MIDRRFEIGAAQLSFLGRSTFTQVPRWTTDDFVRIADDIGIDGYEWHPTKNMTSAHEIHDGNVKRNFKRRVLSGHQSYLGEKTLLDIGKSIIAKPGQLPLIVSSFIFLPHSVDSLQDIAQLQEVVGRQLPVVIYPTEDNSSQNEALASFGDRIFQPTQQVMDEWGVKTIQELVEIYPYKGFDGICFDTTHSRKLGGVDLRQNTEAVKLILKHTKEVHIRPGALDMQSYYHQQDPLGDLRQLVGDDENAWYPQFIKTIAANWQGGRVITEIPTQALEALHAEQKGVNVSKMSVDILIGYHKKAVNNLGKYLTTTEV
jgi:hypothetical protein